MEDFNTHENDINRRTLRSLDVGVCQDASTNIKEEQKEIHSKMEKNEKQISQNEIEL